MNRLFRRPVFLLLTICLLIISLSSCSLYRRIAVNMGAPVVEQMKESFYANCDISIIKESMPFSLAGLSGLIDASPTNTTYLVNGSNAYFAYAFAFVEQGDVLRAKSMYLKARDYGMRALFGKDFMEKIEMPTEEFELMVKKIKKKDVPALFWTTISWLNYIRLNLSDLRSYVEVPKAEAMAKRLIELDETYNFGSPHSIMGCFYAAQPDVAGGSGEKSREHFEKAIKISDGKFLLTYLLYAQFYAVRQQDKELYIKLLTYIREAPEDILPSHCAVTNMSKMRAWRYLKDVDNYF
ncbi:MAG: TRAP transporter TatT component family protein [Desulfobacteraceae bacterium]